MNNEITQLANELAAAQGRLARCEENYLRAKKEKEEAEEIVKGYEDFIQLRRKLYPDQVHPELMVPSSNGALFEERHLPSSRNGIPYKVEFDAWSASVREPLSVPLFRAYLERKYPNSEVNSQSVRNPFREALEDEWIIELKKGAGRSASIYGLHPKHL